jgi:putative membrane protein
VSARFLDEAARAGFDKAVRDIEAVSGAEVVIALRRRSHEYRNANLVVGIVAAFAGLATMLFSQHPFSLASILVDPFVVGLLGAGLVELLPSVKRVLTPPGRRRHHVQRAARTTFLERGVHNTVSRGGLLVYISWLEQQVALVPDTGLAGTLAPDALTQLESELTARVREGGAAVAARLAAAAPELARAMPRRADDVNELPDALDSDLESR